MYYAFKQKTLYLNDENNASILLKIISFVAIKHICIAFSCDFYPVSRDFSPKSVKNADLNQPGKMQLCRALWAKEQFLKF